MDYEVKSTTDDNDTTTFLPERPGSAPPTLTFNSTNLFAFDPSSSGDFFADLRDERSASTAEENYVHSNSPISIVHDTTEDMYPKKPLPITQPTIKMKTISPSGSFSNSAVSSIPIRRKNSIEMFLSQSPSQALGGEFMKLNFKDTKPTPTMTPGLYNSHASYGRYADTEGRMYRARNTTYYNNDATELQPEPETGFSTTTAQLYPTTNFGSENDYAGYNFEPLAVSSNGTEEGKVSMSQHSMSMIQQSSTSHLNTPEKNQLMMVPTHSVVPNQWNYDNQQYNGASTGRLTTSQYPPMERTMERRVTSTNTKMCKFYIQGHCRMGAKCKFAHIGNSNSSSMENMNVSSYKNMQSTNMHYYQKEDPNYANVSTPPFSSFLGESRSNDEMIGTVIDPLGDSSFTELSANDIRGRVFSMSKDQNGCRLLQEQLSVERMELCDLIFEESLDHLSEMMVDPFGNYLFQKLLERVNENQRTTIVRRVSSNLVPAALNLHGTRSVQKVVEVCTSPEQLEVIVDALRDDAVRLCIDSNGNHVIQRALQHMRPEQNQFVFDAVSKECTTVGTHRHGCCVLQRCLDAANQKQKMGVIRQVEKHAMKLMQDPYGNYVVQYVLDSCSAPEAAGVILKPLGHVFELSVQKFSSNVIEKCLEKASTKVKQQYLMEIMHCPKINRMLQDQFANYVVQRALSVCSDELGMMLVNAIRPHLPGIKNTSGGRRITARILKRFPNINIDLQEFPASMSPTFTNSTVMPLQTHDYNCFEKFEKYCTPAAGTGSSDSMGYIQVGGNKHV